MARPVKWTATKLASLAKALVAYADETEVPILAEFAYKNHVRRDQLYEFANTSRVFSNAMEYALAKKEAQLEIGGLSRTLDSSFAKFSLAQLGWSDKQEVTYTLTKLNPPPVVEEAYGKTEPRDDET